MLALTENYRSQKVGLKVIQLNAAITVYTFDCAGQCIWAPGEGRIQSNAKVHAYPLYEKYGLVWIWMGNPALADHNDIFEIENYDEPDMGYKIAVTLWS